MSAFFRSALDVSESEDASGYSSASALHAGPRSIKTSPRPNDVVARTSSSLGALNHNRDLLVHALLEEKCLNDVCDELNAALPKSSPRTLIRDDPEVRTKALERYRLLTAQLVSHGLVNSGPEQDGFFHQINALDISNDNSIGPLQDQFLTRQPRRKLLTDHPATAQDRAVHNLRIAPLIQSDHSHLASQLLPSHPLLDSTRYTRDFEELCMLGKGGYGSVYRVSHRLDGRSYAVKKICLGPSVLSRVQRNGEQELNAILSELRTMARLEHPNIVRYFGGWVEWSKENLTGSPSDANFGRLITEGSSISSSSNVSASSLQRVLLGDSADASLENGILFEDSEQAGPGAQQSAKNSTSGQSESRPQTLSAVATVTDDAVEEIDRLAPDATAPSVSAADSPFLTGPSLTLHIQMSLYPLTLSQYLSSATVSHDDSSFTLQHCFHLPASADIFLAILSGVEHLHAHSIVHRDLKPANIFLNPKLCLPSLIPHGSVNPLACRDCRTASSSPSSWDAGKGDCAHALRLGVCVGDFGLDLDFFALGVMLVEMLVPFSTRMERWHVLSRLREEGEWPAALSGEDMAGVRGLIERMMGIEDGGDMTCDTIRESVLGLLGHDLLAIPRDHDLPLVKQVFMYSFGEVDVRASEVPDQR
ncbi:hypothetical protein ANO11243_066250 [Dothideomycetidae sp. 11243]|nr:hypothetical protein ANO11243_066250 [fungal sp. No.11243]